MYYGFKGLFEGLCEAEETVINAFGLHLKLNQTRKVEHL